VFDATLTTLPFKRKSRSTSQELKTGYKLAESSKESYNLKSAVLPMMMMAVFSICMNANKSFRVTEFLVEI
jgi:hypothetical protein